MIAVTCPKKNHPTEQENIQKPLECRLDDLSTRWPFKLTKLFQKWRNIIEWLKGWDFRSIRWPTVGQFLVGVSLPRAPGLDGGGRFHVVYLFCSGSCYLFLNASFHFNLTFMSLISRPHWLYSCSPWKNFSKVPRHSDHIVAASMVRAYSKKVSEIAPKQILAKLSLMPCAAHVWQRLEAMHCDEQENSLQQNRTATIEA